MTEQGDRLDEIKSRSDLVAFVRSLVEGFGSNESGTSHSCTQEYLEALAAWLDESDDYYAYRGERPLTSEIKWKQVGEMLLAATTYE
jgi:hypothetical protein